MNIEAGGERRHASQMILACALAPVVAGCVLWALVAVKSASPVMRPTTQGLSQSDLPRSLAQGEWLRKTPGWMPAPGFVEVPPLAPQRAVVETPRAQRRLTDHIVDRYQVDTAQAARVVALAYEVADEVKLDPLLLLAVMSVESSFDTFAQSARGAQGLMQIRTQVHAERFEPFGGSEAVFDPRANIRVGAELLRIHLLREGSTEAALKAYVGAARRPHDSGYGARVLRARDVLRGVAEATEDLVMRVLPGASAREVVSPSGS
jgi:soluble lytic murein transglycosylase-like protein